MFENFKRVVFMAIVVLCTIFAVYTLIINPLYFIYMGVGAIGAAFYMMFLSSIKSASISDAYTDYLNNLDKTS